MIAEPAVLVWLRQVLDDVAADAATRLYSRRREVLASVEADRAILAEAAGWGHRVEGDEWYSCSQAVEGRDGEPGSGCYDDERAGKPCDCGLLGRVERIHLALASRYRHRPGYLKEWSR